MPPTLFPTRIESDRLWFERISPDTVDLFEFYEFVTSDAWQEDATEHMPWFRCDRLDEVHEFVSTANEAWEAADTARYLLRTVDDRELIGITGYGPEWEARRAGSGVVLASDQWGIEYGLERASVFVELTFELYDLDAYYATCAAANERSRRMIEKYVDTYGGRYEGLLRQHSPRPNGDVTDQHRFSILRSEFEEATRDRKTLDFELQWEA